MHNLTDSAAYSRNGKGAKSSTIVEAATLNAVGMSITIETITPSIAQSYLNTQLLNRRINKSSVIDYSDRMLRGEWECAQAIYFDTEGRLIDGQHRLSAVIYAQTSISFVVVRGMPPEARHKFDQGRPRSVGQIATIQGMNASHLNSRFAIIRAAFIGQGFEKSQEADDAGKKLGAYYVGKSPDLLIELAHKYEDGLTVAVRSYPSEDKFPRLAAIQSVIFRAYYAVPHQRERINDFIQVLYTGFPTCPKDDDGAITLRQHILRSKEDKALSGSVAIKTEVYAKTQICLKAFLERRSLRRILLPENPKEFFPMADFD